MPVAQTVDEKWQRARLFPVTGIGNPNEQERRGTSVLLAVLSSVKEFRTSADNKVRVTCRLNRNVHRSSLRAKRRELSPRWTDTAAAGPANLDGTR